MYKNPNVSYIYLPINYFMVNKIPLLNMIEQKCFNVNTIHLVLPCKIKI